MSTKTRCYTVTNRTGAVTYVEATSISQAERFMAGREWTVKPTKAADLIAAVRRGIVPEDATKADEPESGDLPLATGA